MNDQEAHVDGVVIGGALQLDHPINLADESRVHVTVVPIASWKEQWRRAMAALEQLKKEYPVDSGGLRYSREELYDRH